MLNMTKILDGKVILCKPEWIIMWSSGTRHTHGSQSEESCLKGLYKAAELLHRTQFKSNRDYF